MVYTMLFDIEGNSYKRKEVNRMKWKYRTETR